MIRAFVVDDHTIFRSGLKRLLLDESDVRITGEARSGADAIDALRAEPFDLVLLDINLEGRSGLEVLATLRREFPSLPVLMLSMYPEEQYALVAMRAGASGYVAKDAEPAELIAAIRSVARGGSYLRRARRVACAGSAQGPRRPSTASAAHGARASDHADVAQGDLTDRHR